MGLCKCCCFQTMKITEGLPGRGQGQPLGQVEETSVCLIPTFAVKRADQSLQYHVHQPTCLGGLCVDCCAEGWCNCRVPFYVYPVDSAGDEDLPVGRIVKVWSGLGNELLGVHQFECAFPHAADAATKARLMGATFLINELFFRHENDDRAAAIIDA
jgi:hypothetical protein